MTKIMYHDLSHRVLNAIFTVHTILGPGLLESAYESAICIEFRHQGIRFQRQKEYTLCYRGIQAGKYYADLVVENKILLELKSVKTLISIMEAQLINYLRLSGIQVGFLVNFYNTQTEFKRFYFPVKNNTRQ